MSGKIRQIHGSWHEVPCLIGLDDEDEYSDDLLVKLTGQTAPRVRSLKLLDFDAVESFAATDFAEALTPGMEVADMAVCSVETKGGDSHTLDLTYHEFFEAFTAYLKSKP